MYLFLSAVIALLAGHCPLSPLLGVPLLLRLVGLRVHVHWRLVVQGGVVVAAGVQELHLHSTEMILKLIDVRRVG